MCVGWALYSCVLHSHNTPAQEHMKWYLLVLKKILDEVLHSGVGVIVVIIVVVVGAVVVVVVVGGGEMMIHT